MSIPDHPSRGRLTGRRSDLRIGSWSAWVVVAFGVGYGVTVVLGFVALGNVRDPLPDPYLAVAEVLIIFMAPAMVVLTTALHACSPPGTRLVSQVAVGFMLLMAGLTMTVHLVELTVARRLDPASVPGFRELFSYEWPSLLYAVDIAAWDLLLGVALLCAALVFVGGPFATVGRGLAVSGVMCLVGLVGPAIGILAWRAIGIAGYAVVFPLTCVALARAFSASPPTDRPIR